MSVKQIIIAVSATSIVSALPQLQPRQSAADFCALKYDDRNAAWTFGGDNSASKFLDKWLTDHTDVNWVNAMDQDTTLHGSVGISNLDCITLDADNCPHPTTNICQRFTPPSLFHVRDAIATIFDMTQLFLDGFRDNVALASLSVTQIKNDFTPAPAGGSIFGLLNGAGTIAAGLAAASPPLTGAATVLAGIFGILASIPSSGGIDNDPTADMETFVKNTFVNVRSATSKFIKTVVAGSTDGLDPKSLPGANVPGPNGETQPIAAFFSGGKYLFNREAKNGVTPSLNGTVGPILDSAYKTMTQGLVFEAIRSTNYYVFVEVTRNKEACDAIKGSSFINDRCFTLERSGKPMEADTASKLTDTKLPYNIDLPTMYGNAWDCFTAKGYDGAIEVPQFSPTNTNGGVAYPKCFVNIPVIVARGEPCNVVRASSITCNAGSLKYKQDVFDRLGFSQAACGDGV